MAIADVQVLPAITTTQPPEGPTTDAADTTVNLATTAVTTQLVFETTNRATEQDDVSTEMTTADDISTGMTTVDDVSTGMTTERIGRTSLQTELSRLTTEELSLLSTSFVLHTTTTEELSVTSEHRLPFDDTTTAVTTLTPSRPCRIPTWLDIEIAQIASFAQTTTVTYMCGEGFHFDDGDVRKEATCFNGVSSVWSPPFQDCTRKFSVVLRKISRWLLLCENRTYHEDGYTFVDLQLYCNQDSLGM